MKKLLKVVLVAAAATPGFVLAATVSGSPGPTGIGGQIFTSVGPAYGIGGIALSGASGYGFLSNPLVAAGSPFSFCVELTQSLLPDSNFTVVDPTPAYAGTDAIPIMVGTPATTNNWGVPHATISDKVDRLLTYALGSTVLGMGTNTNVYEDLASLQLAIWNAIYDNDNVVESTSLGPGAGFAVVINSVLDNTAGSAMPAQIYARANAFISGSSSVVNPTHYLVLTSPNRQDLLVVPEPSSIALTSAALLALALTRRRRSAAAT